MTVIECKRGNQVTLHIVPVIASTMARLTDLLLRRIDRNDQRQGSQSEIQLDLISTVESRKHVKDLH